jgi:hypothetical protein
MADANELQRINAVRLTTGDVLAFLTAGAAIRRFHREDDDDGLVGVDAAYRLLLKDQGEKAFALLSRLQALTLLLREGLPGWSMPNPGADGGAIASAAVFAAAAEHPLVVRDGTYVFERATFLDRVLLKASPETRA